MATTTAGQVAAELRRVAEALEKQPDVEIDRPMLAFWPTNKEEFLGLAKSLPRPLQKRIDGEDGRYQKYVLENKGPVWIYCGIDRSKLCVMVEPARPARYECPSILSAEEEESLGVF